MKIQWTILTAVFFALVLLKILKLITWSWWVVLMPFWIPSMFVYIAFTIGVFIQWKKISGDDEE